MDADHAFPAGLDAQVADAVERLEQRAGTPFETRDAQGVGQLVRMGAWLGRKTKHSLKLGVSGEHAGDPASTDFFHDSEIDYVSRAWSGITRWRFEPLRRTFRKPRCRGVRRSGALSSQQALPTVRNEVKVGTGGDRETSPRSSRATTTS